jgi:hypothetical protein
MIAEAYFGHPAVSLSGSAQCLPRSLGAIMTPFIKYPVQAVGLCWFREEDYPALLAMFTDADKMHVTWKEWRENAERLEKRAQAEGHVTERVYIDPKTFPDWCARENVTVDRDGRGRFVGVALAKRLRIAAVDA